MMTAAVRSSCAELYRVPRDLDLFYSLVVSNRMRSIRDGGMNERRKHSHQR